MELEARLLRKARECLAAQKEKNIALREQREQEAYARIPALRRINAAQQALVGQVLEVTVGRRAVPAELDAILRRSQELLEEQAELLTAAGYPADFLDEIVTCPNCGDSGYLPSGQACSCLLALYEAERTRELSSVLKDNTDGFADFSLDYYSGTARECMEMTLDAAKHYAVCFGADSPNLLFQGGTGLGKTFLSGCIAKTVSDNGHSVVYESVQEAFSAFEEKKFSRDAETYAEAAEKVRRILRCELLILDDLGTELTTSFTQEALYHILNTRLTAGRRTIISTNLSDGELAARYTPQIISRINGEFDTLLFMGRDIRAIKKEQRYGGGTD